MKAKKRIVLREGHISNIDGIFYYDKADRDYLSYAIDTKNLEVGRYQIVLVPLRKRKSKS